MHVRYMYKDCSYIARPKALGIRINPDRYGNRSFRYGLRDTVMRMLQLISSSPIPALVRTCDSILIFLASIR